MSDTQAIAQFKFKVAALELKLADKQKQLEEYQTIQSEADAKIKALNKIHADKVKNLLNSIQILKKQKASIEGLSKEHKRSKLIEQLNKQIADQDLAIEVLRKYIYDKEGKDKGREACDEIIVKALTKGPDRIRPLSREQLRMEIDRLKSINLSMENKAKNKGAGRQSGDRNNEGDQKSEISQISEESFVNHNEGMLKRMRELQFENENMKLEVNAKLKIIEKLKNDAKEKDKLKTELQIYRSQVEVANKKVATFEKLMKESKQKTNIKIVELYERQIKVEELEIVSKENRDKLQQAQQGHNILIEEIRLEKEQLEAEIESLKSQNEQLILENITSKKRLAELKKIIKDMDDINGKQKEDMKEKMTNLEEQIKKIVAENNKYTQAYRDVESTLFQERAQWVEQKAKLIQELANVRENAGSKQLVGKYMQDIFDLKEENSKLKQMLESGGGGGDDHLLLQRLNNYKRKIDFYQSKGDKSAERSLYDQLFKKYNDLAEQFSSYKLKFGDKTKKKDLGRKHYIDVTKKEESEYEAMSSGISKLNLEQIGSDILDNFNSSYEFEFVLNEHGDRVKMPRITQADRELLKLMTSDLWNFVSDDKMERKIEEAASFYEIEDRNDVVDANRVRKIKNLSHPRGRKVVMYENEVGKLDDISDSISVTSALEKQLNKYDSDIDVEMKKMPRGVGKEMNLYGIENLSISVEGVSSVSSAKEGESNIGSKRKKGNDKASRIEAKPKSIENSSDFGKSSIGSSLIDSDVSSEGIRDSELALINSDLEPNFRKNKK